MATNIEVKPFIKWVGGKRQLLNEIRDNLPDIVNNYYEPFIGGGALFFDYGKNINKAYISDINSNLICTYRTVRDNVEQLICSLKQHEQNHSVEYYYDIRNMDRSDRIFTDLEIASRFIYLNKTCFNGIHRLNSKGHFNVPMGKYKNPMICDEYNLRNCSVALKDITIECHSFLDIEPKLKTGDFVYFDPPYIPINATSNFTSYTAEDFNIEMQETLRLFCNRLTEKGINFLQSNSDTEITRELYKDFQITTVSARRAINSKSDSRGNINEVLISNYKKKDFSVDN